MHVSHFHFHTIPGKTNEVEQQLQKLREMVVKAGGSQKMSRLLTQSPKREVYLVAD